MLGKEYKMRNSAFIIGGVFIGVLVLVNLFFKVPIQKNLHEKAEFEIEGNRPELAEKTFKKMLQKDSLDIEIHYQYIQNHFEIPETQSKNSLREKRNDEEIITYYGNYTQSMDSVMSDIGYYGYALIKVHLKEFTGAVYEFKNVKNRGLKYLNNSLGYAYNELGAKKAAEKHFKLEIKNNGNIEGAYSNLFVLLQEQRRFEDLKAYYNNPKSKNYMPINIILELKLIDLQFFSYFKILLKTIFSSGNLWGVGAAFLILGSWVMYLRKVDFYNKESWVYIFIVVCLGMLFSLATFPISDLLSIFSGLKLKGEFLNDLFMCVLKIGAVEELVKIIPLLLILKFTNVVKEPFDYIKYASLSALGFSFVENILYFDEGSLHIIHGRALASSVIHMFDSSIIAYGLIISKYRRKNNPWINLLLSYLIASIYHGLFDFFLMSEAVKSFSFLSLIMLIFSAVIWNRFKINALNISPFFDEKKVVEEGKIGDYLTYSLVGVLIFEYVALAANFGPSLANDLLFESFHSGTYLLAIILGTFNLYKGDRGKWNPIVVLNE